MAFLDLEKTRTSFCSILFLLLLAVSSNVLASDAQIFDSTGHRSRRSPPIFKAQDLVERKPAALTPESAVSGNVTAPVPSPSSPPSNEWPALVTPSANSPGGDLLPMDLPTPPAPGSQPVPEIPINSPPSTSRKQSKVPVILGVTLGAVLFLLVSLSATAYFKPDWLPCCKGRSSQITQYERHLPT